MRITCRCIASAEIYARAGRGVGSLDAGGLGGRNERLLEPLVEALRRYVMAAGKLHADDTPVPVLAPGNGKTKTGRLWTYVRDDRPAGTWRHRRYGLPTRRIARASIRERHLREFRRHPASRRLRRIQPLYENGRIQEAACWAHVRRKFFDLQQAHASPVASEALERIAALYAIEREIRGRPAGRAATSSQRACPTVARISATVVRSDAAEAFAQVGYDGGDSLRALALGGA